MIRLTGEIILDIVIPSGSGRKAAAITTAFDRLVAAAREDFGDDGLTLRETTITGAKTAKDGEPYSEPDGLPLFRPWEPRTIGSDGERRFFAAFTPGDPASVEVALGDLYHRTTPGAGQAIGDGDAEYASWLDVDAERAVAALDDFVVTDAMFERQSIADPDAVLPLRRDDAGRLEIGLNGVIFVPPMADSFCAEDGPVSVAPGTGYSDPDAGLPGFLRD